MIFIVLLLIFFLGFSTFMLFPWHHVHGVFRISDLGLLLIILTLANQFHKSVNRGIVFNKIGMVIFFYLVLTLIQVVNASVNYNQSIIPSLRGFGSNLQHPSGALIPPYRILAFL